MHPQRANHRSPVGGLTAEWAQRTGLKAGIPVAVGAFDAHLGGVGRRHQAGHARENHRHQHLRLDGRARRATTGRHSRPVRHRDGSILPGYFGLEAGQSAVGDIFNWFVNYLKAGTHEDLTAGRRRN